MGIAEGLGVSGGRVDSEAYFDPKDELAQRARRVAEAESAAIRERMAAPGALGLPPLLEARRLEYGITDGAFDAEAAFERIHIFQILPKSWTGGKIAGGKLWAPDTIQTGAERTSARGILISAGLRALDILRSNGFDLGHIVHFISMAPFRTEADCVAGTWKYIKVMNVGDLTGSEDLRANLRHRLVGIRRDATTLKHYIPGEGEALTPWVSDDM
jgi:hypothetical protein